MQQGSKSIRFIMIELVYRAFKTLSYFIKESSLLYSKSLNKLFILTFYIDDFFEKFINFKKQYEFLRYHFLSKMK